MPKLINDLNAITNEGKILMSKNDRGKTSFFSRDFLASTSKKQLRVASLLPRR